MELGTFGAVFQAAIKLEAHLSQRYDIQSANQVGDMREIYRALARSGRKRLRRLERLRRETVTEMILEPIRDLTLSQELALLETVDPGAPLAPDEARRLELDACAFYREAAEKIGLAEAAGALRQLGEENAQRAAQIAG